MSGEAMASGDPGLTRAYSYLQAWAYDRFVAERVIGLHPFFFELGRLDDVFSESLERRVLDVGCGGGHPAVLLQEQHPHLHLVGIDLDANQIARARQRARDKGYAIDFEVADAQALPFPDASFDVVYSIGSAKHWPVPLKGIGECWRVLKPGGELLIADATSDATRDEMVNFCRIVRFPKMLEKVITRVLYRGMFRPAQNMESYYRIAAQLGMPQGAVSHPPSLPVFFFRTRKPLPQPAQ
jgi:SAM-dependent methyltransferase